MTGRERLDRYLNALRRRLRTSIYAQAFALSVGAALLITAAAVGLLPSAHYSQAVVIAGRVMLALALIGVIYFCAWRPLRRLASDRGATVFEARLPDQHGRLQTYLDAQRADHPPSPLIDLLADDAASIAERTPVESVVSMRRVGSVAGLGAVAVAALALMLAVGPGHWGFGSRHFLLGAELPRSAVPVRKVLVEPGDATVRRNSDLAIRATVSGFKPQTAQLFVRFADRGEAAQWERAPMQASSDEDARFEFKLYAVRGPLSYYVDVDGARSAEHRVGVVDLPKIERVRLTYDYPEWTGLERKTDEDVRDIRAVAGTNVKVEVFADAPLEAPALIVDGATRELAGEDRTSVGSIEVLKPGRYQIGARVADEFVALSDEYAIEITPDEKPVIEIKKPGRDWRATSIEEVPVRVDAQDDFRLREVQLRYSVNGGEWRALPLAGAGVQRTASDSLLRLEELGPEQAPEGRLAPGDLVSYYAVAKDRNHTAQTDLFMVQVQPFERRFTQAQGGGGGGQMSDDQGAISERQREILLATWNLQRNDERNARSRAQLEDNAQMLAELQTTLAQQTRTLAERTRARASLEDERIKAFVESLDAAAEAMDPAAKRLTEFKLADAVPLEQRALQQLLRAESAFRDVQVSMQQQSPGGGGAQAARNFTEMFELEMDLEKNQYESESQLSMQNDKEELNEAIRKLKELAERQEKLAEEARRDRLNAQEQRWKQEQLRREAEDLRRQLAEMNRQQQQQGSQQASSSAQGSGEASSSTGSSSRDGEQREEREELEQALASVNRALEEMRAANEGAGRDQSQASEAARKAGQNLRRALDKIDQPEPSGMGEALEQLAERAGEAQGEQRRIESELYQALAQGGRDGGDQLGSRTSIDRRKAQELVQSKQELAEQLSELQNDLRGAVHEHRQRQPETSRRVGEILRDLETSDVMYRINRSAAEIYYGRAREAALREGLISEALEALEKDLREAAALAANESEGERRDAREGPEALLAEAAEMRRALSPGERGGAETSQGGVLSQPGDAPRGAAIGAPRESQERSGSLARETGVIGQRVRDVANRMNRGELTQAEFDALRKHANELRRLAGDPMADRQALLSLIDQIELLALSAAPPSEDSAAARRGPSYDSPRYREAVAEYYRRLGNK